MIIRHIPMKSARKSSFSGLVRYLVDEQNKQERVGQVRVSNCHNDEMVWALQEVAATQAMNQRAKGDKTWHMIISFAKGEVLSDRALNDIENRVVQVLGFANHQRISVVHHDTDNLHVHVAINKINPVTHTLQEPYKAYKQLGEIAAELEIEYQLQPTCHSAQKSHSENLADDMEHHAGIESLLGWIKRHCQTELGEAQNWSAFHAVLNRHGLTARERGNGLIFTTPKGLSVKASSVSRQFSKSRLEEKFGMFTTNNSGPAPDIQYDQHPIYTNTNALYFRFCAEKLANKARLSETMTTIKNRKNRLIEQARQQAQLKRTAIKLIKGRLNKRVLYALTHKSLQTTLQLIRQQYIHEHQKIFETYRSLTWLDWLQHEANQGNKDALAALRTRRVKPATKSYTLSGESNTSPSKPNNPTKQGTNIHRKDECTIRDEGTNLIISRGFSIQGLKTALLMAQKKFGSTIKVNGSEAFKQAIVQIAASFKIPIQFEDKDLEQQRQQLSNNLTQQEYQNEKSRNISSPTIGKGPRATGTGNRLGRRNAGRNPATTKQQKPNPGSIGSNPPPESKNRLRNLSELRVVQLSRGREVLLQGYVHGKLERERAKFNYKL